MSENNCIYQEIHSWQKRKLDEVAEIISGGTPNTRNAKYWNGKIAWLTPKDLSNFSGRYISKGERNISKEGLEKSNAKLVPKGTVLLTTRAPIGYLAIAENEISTNQGFQSLIPSRETDSLFLFYLLKQNVKYLESQSEGSTFGELPKSTLQLLCFQFPPLPLQKVIGEILSSLDDKIDLLHCQNKTLENLAQTLFREWFIENVGDDWEEISLADIYVFEKGIEPGSKNYIEEPIDNTIRFIRVGDMLKNDPSIFIDENIVINTCSQDDLLVSFDGTVGRVVFGISGAHSSGIRKITSDSPIYNCLGFKYLLFKSHKIQSIIRAHATGTVLLHAGGSIGYLKFALPQIQTIERFNKKVNPIFNKILNNLNQISTLENLRNALLPQLLNGKLIVT